MKQNIIKFTFTLTVSLFLAAYAGAADLNLPATLNGPYTASGNISNSGTSVVNSGSVALCATPAEITLLPGFEAKAGSEFRAKIDDLTGLSETDDTDSDKMPDWWEYVLYGDMDEDKNADFDKDLVADYLEWIIGSDPLDSSSTPEPSTYYEYDALGRIKSIIRLK